MNYFLATLLQLVLYLGLMLVDEYGGTLLAVILGSICLAVWVISLIVEWIEPSRVTGAYYKYIFTGWLAPLMALIGYVMLRGEIDWLTI